MAFILCWNKTKFLKTSLFDTFRSSSPSTFLFLRPKFIGNQNGEAVPIVSLILARLLKIPPIPPLIMFPALSRRVGALVVVVVVVLVVVVVVVVVIAALTIEDVSSLSSTTLS